MPSTIAWLDYSEHERQRAMEIVRLFEERGTVDELGVGTIRDALADRLFPGLSTIQSRARYFLLIPWIYKDLERRLVGADRVAAEARKMEIALINVLADSDDPSGTIGINARERLKNLPSRIYWSGLKAWGIREFPGSQDAYHRSLNRFYETPTFVERTDDGDVMGGKPAVNWHSGLPAAPRKFPAETSLTLTENEAAYLVERLALSQPRSLVSWLASHGRPDLDADFPWEHRQFDDLPSHNRDELNHSRAFSELMHGAALLYNFMLSEKAGHSEWEEDYGERLEFWRAMIVERWNVLSTWQRDRFWELVLEINPRIPMPTRLFVDRWLDVVLKSKGMDVSASDPLRDLIITREGFLKGELARLVNKHPLERWQGTSGAGQLDYRWLPVARDTLHDIQFALGRAPL